MSVKTLKVTVLYFFRTDFVFFPAVPITRRSYSMLGIVLRCRRSLFFQNVPVCGSLFLHI